MRKISTISLVLLGVFVFCGVLRADDATPPEAAPMIQTLKAIQADDVDAFKNAFSKRIREHDDQASWNSHFKDAKQGMQKYGDYKLSDFTYTYAGDDQKGELTIIFKGKKSDSMAVVKEGDDWKLDSH